MWTVHLAPKAQISILSLISCSSSIEGHVNAIKWSHCHTAFDRTRDALHPHQEPLGPHPYCLQWAPHSDSPTSAWNSAQAQEVPAWSLGWHCWWASAIHRQTSCIPWQDGCAGDGLENELLYGLCCSEGEPSSPSSLLIILQGTEAHRAALPTSQSQGAFISEAIQAQKTLSWHWFPSNSQLEAALC